MLKGDFQEENIFTALRLSTLPDLSNADAKVSFQILYKSWIRRKIREQKPNQRKALTSHLKDSHLFFHLWMAGVYVVTQSQLTFLSEDFRGDLEK